MSRQHNQFPPWLHSNTSGDCFVRPTQAGSFSFLPDFHWPRWGAVADSSHEQGILFGSASGHSFMLDLVLTCLDHASAKELIVNIEVASLTQVNPALVTDQ